MMRLEETVKPDGTLGNEQQGMVKLFGVAGYTYRDLITQGANWAVASLAGRESKALEHECRVRYLTTYIRHRYGEVATQQRRSPVAEVVAFTKAMLYKKAQGS